MDASSSGIVLHNIRWAITDPPAHTPTLHLLDPLLLLLCPCQYLGACLRTSPAFPLWSCGIRTFAREPAILEVFGNKASFRRQKEKLLLEQQQFIKNLQPLGARESVTETDVESAEGSQQACKGTSKILSISRLGNYH